MPRIGRINLDHPVVPEHTFHAGNHEMSYRESRHGMVRINHPPLHQFIPPSMSNPFDPTKAISYSFSGYRPYFPVMVADPITFPSMAFLNSEREVFAPRLSFSALRA
jgi:hypothetical protein